jgi:hypothetical protein
MSAPRPNASAIALLLMTPALAACGARNGDTSAGTGSSPAVYVAPRTPWGDPDLQGVWPGTAMTGVPLQRDEKLGTRAVLTDDEFAARSVQSEQQLEQDNAQFDVETADVSRAGAVGSPTSPPPHWLERGQPQRQASLIADPPNGRLPPLTAAAEQRQTALRQRRAERGPADSYTDRSLYDRCITRGLVSSMLPAIYNAGNQIVQASGYVVIMNEMIHDARIVPLDGRAHVGGAIEEWLGDSRGHFEGDTLVVETTNFTDRTAIGGTAHSAALKTAERFTRTSANTLEYAVTIDDPETWSAPWTIRLPLERDDGYGMFEYACHEGNRAMANILSGARAAERSADR